MKKLLFILLVFSGFSLSAQNLKNLRQKSFDYADTLYLDTMTVLPASIEIFADGVKISDTLWIFDAIKSELIFKDSIEKKHLTVKYRVLDYNFKTDYFLDTNRILPKMKNFEEFYGNSDRVGDLNEIVSSGVLSRGISIGTNQDAVVSSKLNLQLSGNITDDLSIEASLTDENMPVQPDGNTAQIKDFNKVFMKIKSNEFSVMAGDFSVKNGNTVFLKYDKQINGIGYVRRETQLSEKYEIEDFEAGVSMAKGNYARNEFKGEEGNQGPYKLQGTANETFILVLAGSEKVFLDGKLLQRGESNDYTIDYNAAEITFTPNCLITKDSRIIVEFEYSTRNYARFQSFSSAVVKSDNFRFYYNFLSEKDAKNQPIDRELTDEMKIIMANAGDNPDSSLILNADTVEYSADKILYEKKDTLIDNAVYEIFVYSTNPQAVLYNVSFAYVGKGNGNYEISLNSVNGRIYEFVAPENDEMQGSYSPYNIIVTPKKHSVYEAGVGYEFNDKNKLSVSVAVSNKDLNLFSAKDDADNTGLATYLNFAHFFSGNDTTPEKSFIYSSYRYVQRNFAFFRDYRNVEFFRDWNLQEKYSAAENFFSGGYVLNNSGFNVNLSADALFYPKIYTAAKPKVSVSFKNTESEMFFNSSLMYSEDTLNRTSFLKTDFRYKRLFAKNFAEIGYADEVNLWHSAGSNTYNANSFMFHSYNLKLGRGDTLRNFVYFRYHRRWDYFPVDDKLKISSISNDFSVVSKMFRNSNMMSFVLNYRQLYVSDTALTDIKPDNSLNGQISGNYFFLKKSLHLGFSAGLLSGMEQKKQFVFVEVEPGKGVYTWIDYNDDGIKQTDEFEIAEFGDLASFVKVPVQSNDYEKVFTKKMMTTLGFYPQNLFEKQSKFVSFLSKTDNSFSFLLNKKSYALNLCDFSYSDAVNYTASFNYTGNVRLFERLVFSYLRQKSILKTMLINGADFNFLSDDKFIVKYSFLKKWTLINEFSAGNTQTKSEYSALRNYDLSKKNEKIEVIYGEMQNQARLSYLYSEKRNKSGDEVVFINKISLNGIISSGKLTNFGFDLSYVNNAFSGNEVSPVAYTMLEGLKNGKNYTWQVSMNRNLGKYLRLTLTYSGRFSENSKIIHFGSVNLSALL